MKKVKAMNRDVQGDFFKLPQFLFKEQKYEGLSDRAKIFYSMLCNKLSLSLKNEWRDEDGDTYLYFSVSEATKILGASHSTISKIYAELEKAGLIFREKQGMGRPRRVYLTDISKEKKKENIASIEDMILADYR